LISTHLIYRLHPPAGSLSPKEVFAPALTSFSTFILLMSSLLYVIGGLAQASRGKVFVDGNELTAMSDAERTKLRRHKIGFVFQRFNLLPTLTAKGNIAIAQYIHGNGFDPHRFEVVTKLLGLEGRLNHKPSEMSG